MHRSDPFEARLTAAVRMLADDADTRVDAVAMAERARRLSHSVTVGWLRRMGFAAVAAALVAVTVMGWQEYQQRGIGPAATPTPTPTAQQTPVPTPTLFDNHSGWTMFVGTETFTVVSAGTTDAGGHTSGIEIATSDQASDARATGTGRMSLNADTSGDLALLWGPYRLETTLGAWEGTCRGSSSAGSRDLTCWLAGSGKFKGFTYSFFLRTAGATGHIQGLIYPGSPPEP